MKTIFLDFDGVLNSREHFSSIDESNPPNREELAAIRKIHDQYANRYTKSMIAHDLRSLSRELVQRVEKMVKLSGASVVISSSWRFGHSTMALQGILSYHGFTGPILGSTPVGILALQVAPRPYGGTKFKPG